MFEDRADAGRRLARALSNYKSRHAVVLALPRGGVPVAAEVAAALAAPLDLILVRKIGVPGRPELAMGAIVDGSPPIIVRNEDIIALSGVTEVAFEAVCAQERTVIERRRRAYLGARPRVEVAGHVVIVIDDGIATGATTRAALQAIRRSGPKEVVLAVPVAPLDTIRELSRDVDAVVCLETPQSFATVGAFYRKFGQVSDRQVEKLLERFPVREIGRVRELES